MQRLYCISLYLIYVIYIIFYMSNASSKCVKVIWTHFIDIVYTMRYYDSSVSHNMAQAAPFISVADILSGSIK